MPKVVIVGGGIIGLCSAYYLLNKGYEITIIDKGDMLDGCSYGNAGYISPSHFVPLAAPGIVKQGFKWMMNSKSPFYVQPRLNRDLFEWGIKFIKASSKAHVESSYIPLRDISLLSKKLYEELNVTPGFDFYFEKKGMLEFFKTEENAHHAIDLVNKSKELGLEAKLLTRQEVQQLEPATNLDIKGAVYFECDAHLYPVKLMNDMITHLKNNSAIIHTNQEVKNFIIEKNIIKKVITGSSEYTAAHFIIAAGVWSRELASTLGLKLPMVGGRGYSFTFDDLPFKIHHPIILSEARVAITPMAQNKIRFGGTMEITSLHTAPRMNRVKGIYESIQKYFPEANIPFPSKDKVWCGFRPCSADGLPYIGKVNKYENLVIATGHAMLGLSLGPATGKLVSELIDNAPLSMNIDPFDPERFN